MKNIATQGVKTYTSFSNTRRAAALRYFLVIAISAGCAWSFVARTDSTRDRADVSHVVQPAGMPKASPLPITQSSEPPITTPGIGVTVTHQGFYPSKVTRPPGRFVFAVVNKTALSTISLSLDSPGGAPMRTKQMRKEEPHWADVYDLTPGLYILREATHPAWTCEIVIK